MTSAGKLRISGVAAYLVALAALFLAAVVGCYFPGRAAMRIEPLLALRQE